MFHTLEQTLLSYADKLPLEIFLFIGSIVEEVIAPIPSPFVPVAAGSVSEIQGKAFFFLFWLALFGAVGKLIGAWFLYLAADKAEDVVLGKFGKFLGISHKEVEAVGKHLNHGGRDIIVLTALRALPIMSSTLISLVSGILKVNKKTYTVATLVGTYLRDLLFLYFGYAGLHTFGSLVTGLEDTESKIQAIAAVGILIFLVWIFFKRRKSH
ncbi:MAG: VTT domain-containing protein [Patescibacteria group bacterium]